MTKSTSYSEKVLDHFHNPRNVGELEGDNVSRGRVGNPVCGDLMDIYIEVAPDDEGVERIKDIRFKTFGCGSAVATSSMITEIARGKTLEEALAITRNDVADELDGLPPIKMHCSNLAADALHEAIKNYIEACSSTIAEGGAAGGSKRETDAEKERGQLPAIEGEADYLGKGMFHSYKNPEYFEQQRVLVYGVDENAVEVAEAVAPYAQRVVLVTPHSTLDGWFVAKSGDGAKNIKLLKESVLVKVGGFDEVETVRIHDLDEDEEYDLFVDAVINTIKH